MRITTSCTWLHVTLHFAALFPPLPRNPESPDTARPSAVGSFRDCSGVRRGLSKERKSIESRLAVRESRSAGEWAGKRPWLPWWPGEEGERSGLPCGVACTMAEKYFSCSTLVDMFSVFVAETKRKPWCHLTFSSDIYIDVEARSKYSMMV